MPFYLLAMQRQQHRSVFVVRRRPFLESNDCKTSCTAARTMRRMVQHAQGNDVGEQVCLDIDHMLRVRGMRTVLDVRAHISTDTSTTAGTNDRGVCKKQKLWRRHVWKCRHPQMYRMPARVYPELEPKEVFEMRPKFVRGRGGARQVHQLSRRNKNQEVGGS